MICRVLANAREEIVPQWVAIGLRPDGLDRSKCLVVDDWEKRNAGPRHDRATK